MARIYYPSLLGDANVQIAKSFLRDELTRSPRYHGVSHTEFMNEWTDGTMRELAAEVWKEVHNDTR